MTRSLSDSLPPEQRSQALRRRSDAPIGPIRPQREVSNSTRWNESFIYRPLELAGRSIRVLEVLPRAAPVQLVSCRLTHQPLDAGTHIALSYTWGPLEPKFPIEINNSLFFVRKNLFDFLTHADVVGKLLWIDAICIDQANTAERVHQVHLMDRVYSRAKNVIVWLGCGDEEITEALKQAAADHDMNDELDELSDSGRDSLTDYAYANRPAAFLDQAAQTHLHPFWNSYEKLCSLPYWKRVWILQEVILNDNVTILYGDVRCCWRCFVHVIRRSYRAKELQRITASSAYHVFRLKESQDGPAPPKSLPFILDQSLKSSCSDFHDRIFGILGLLEGAESFHIDYSQSELELAVTTALFYIQGMALKYGLYKTSSKAKRALGDILLDLLCRGDVPRISRTFRSNHLPSPRGVNLVLPLHYYVPEHSRIREPGKLYCFTLHPSSQNLEFRAGDGLYQYGFSDDTEAISIIVTRRLQGVERVVARAHQNRETGSEPAVEYYDHARGLAHGLPGAIVNRASSKLEIDNTFTTAILVGLSEDAAIRRTCVPVMLDMVLKWQRMNMYSKNTLAKRRSPSPPRDRNAD